LDQEYREQKSQLSPTLVKKEFERVTIELSWKSSVIEGNTYSLLETETLLKQGIEAVGKKAEEARMLLNHKEALEFLRDMHSRRLSIDRCLHRKNSLHSDSGIRSLQKSKENSCWYYWDPVQTTG
jgi:Fic family protein